jgi:hypothetical protein
VTFTQNNSSGIELLFSKPTYLASYKHIRIFYDVLENIDPSNQVMSLAWTEGELYLSENKFSHPSVLSGKSFIVCPYSNWISAHNIRKVFIKPFDTGRILIKNIKLLP